MSSHFSANQYEAAFSPQRLQNYQVPVRHKKHPSMRSGCTQIISNERGHLNSNTPRSPASPWGSFVGTWQAERKPIKLKTRTKLMTHLSKIDKQGGGSKYSSRAASAHVSRESQRGSVTSPRPQSAQEAQRREDQETQPAASPGNLETPQPPSTANTGSKPPTPAIETGSKPAGSKPPTPTSVAGSKPPTPTSVAGSKPPTPAIEAGSKPPTPTKGRPGTATSSAHGSRTLHSKTPAAAGDTSRTASPQSSTGPRIASAASTRISMSVSSAPSRAQSATVARTPHQPPPGSTGSSVPASCGREVTQTTPQAATPHNAPAATAAANSNITSENSSRAQTGVSDHSPHNQ